MLVRRYVTVVAWLALLSAAAIAQQPPPVHATAATVVYITKTGEKYHRDGCSSLRKSRIPVSLKEAVARGYGACKNCKPPQMAER